MTNLGSFAAAAYQTWLSLETQAKANEELRQSALPLQRFASIVESSDDAIVSKNLDGIITSWNRGAQRLFGYTADEAVGKPITMLIPADQPDEEPRILERIRRGERIDHMKPSAGAKMAAWSIFRSPYPRSGRRRVRLSARQRSRGTSVSADGRRNSRTFCFAKCATVSRTCSP